MNDRNTGRNVDTLRDEWKFLRSERDDMAFIGFRILDAAGTLCPHADHEVRFRIDGPADMAAICNGDATSLESFQRDRCRVFSGQGMLTLRSRAGARGDIRVHAEAEGLAPASVRIASVQAGR